MKVMDKLNSGISKKLAAKTKKDGREAPAADAERIKKTAAVEEWQQPSGKNNRTVAVKLLFDKGIKGSDVDASSTSSSAESSKSSEPSS